jgi:hypothetical protein
MSVSSSFKVKCLNGIKTAEGQRCLALAKIKSEGGKQMNRKTRI